MRKNDWHILAKNPKDLPDPGEHVIICVGKDYIGEGWLLADGHWQRYCDFAPIEQWMHQNVTAWMRFPASPFL